MASGHVNRTERPNTWLHRPMLQNVKKALANTEPSTHGTKRKCRTYLGDVRCWVNSGSHLLALSISEFDPTRTDGRRLLRRPMARRLLACFGQFEFCSDLI